MGIVIVAGGTVEILCLRLAWWRGGWHGGDWRGDRHGECFFFFFFWVWLLWPMFGFGCCVVSGFGGSMVAGFLWWFIGGSCVAEAMAIVFGGFGPSGYGVVGFDSGLILFYGFDSHRRYGCSV